MTKALLKTTPQLQQVSFGSEVISFSVAFRKRQTLAISVYPDTSVGVVAPEGQKLEAIKAKVIKRASWIIKQKNYFSKFLPKQPARQFVSGETQRYLGRQYRIKVTQGATERVLLKGAYFQMTIEDRSDSKRIGALLSAWYRDHAEVQFATSLDRCLKLFSRIALATPTLKIRQMPKRWGSCTKNGVIYLNPDLVKAPRHCIDYVMTHELCHLKHKHHGKEYYRLLKRVMPDWEERKQRLEFGDVTNG